MTAPRIALISATPAAIGPAVTGLHDEFPEADPWNLLDDKLLADADAQGGLSAPLEERMNRLIGHALAEGADAVLLTCSIYGEVAQRTVAPVPVLAPDEAAFEEALSGRYRRILIAASFKTAQRDALRRFKAAAEAAHSDVEIHGTVAPDAFEASRVNDTEGAFAALLEACKPYADRIDAVLLAQYSLAPAAAALSDALGIPVISGPHSAAAKLKLAIKAHS